MRSCYLTSHFKSAPASDSSSTKSDAAATMFPRSYPPAEVLPTSVAVIVLVATMRPLRPVHLMPVNHKADLRLCNYIILRESAQLDVMHREDVLGPAHMMQVVGTN